RRGTRTWIVGAARTSWCCYCMAQRWRPCATRTGTLVFRVACTSIGPLWLGQSLAKGVKAAMLQLIRARHPQVRTMTTFNAEANPAIRSINERLGFAVYRHDGTYQIGTEALAQELTRTQQ